jgi:hypothetical protein
MSSQWHGTPTNQFSHPAHTTIQSDCIILIKMSLSLFRYYEAIRRLFGVSHLSQRSMLHQKILILRFVLLRVRTI